jgi:hypothetical protein
MADEVTAMFQQMRTNLVARQMGRLCDAVGGDPSHETRRAFRDVVNNVGPDTIDVLVSLLANACSPQTASGTRTIDQAHVFLDALAALVDSIDAGATPWADYHGGADDPKLDATGYRSLIIESRSDLNRLIDKG